MSNETICFIDGVHPTHNTVAAYGWIKVGERKEIPSNTGRSRLNISASIDMLNKKVVLHEDKTLNTASTLAFFKKIEEAYP
ncbi:MAG: transposase, partial [Simkaniaceae bacterium]|nr:transposase [Simkaniaceae bacterium]